MKKPHKSKAHRPQAKRRHRERVPAALAPHSSRRPAPVARPDPRRTRPPRPAPVGVYRRPTLLRIESKADRHAFRLLLLPFVLMALALAVVPSLHVFPTLRDLIAATPISTAAPVRDVAVVAGLTRPHAVASPVALETLAVAKRTGAPAPLPAITANDIPQPPSGSVTAVASMAPDRALTSAHPDLARAASVTADRLLPPPLDPQVEAPAPAPHFAPSRLARAQEARSPDLSLPAIRETKTARPAPLRPMQTQLALLAPSSAPRALSPLPPAPYQPFCQVNYGSAAVAESDNDAVPPDASFGQRLATAAAAQTAHFVIYDDKYRQIARAGGDVPPLYGVCTDVVVRAYRALGVDLQVLVHASRVGAGDPNIDHRRTETLRRYFARYGQSLPVTPHGEDYQPGDIVTYWRPQNSGSRSHIAIVAATTGPSGRPMIIHNRGWGPQLEDGLFVDRITGHYRYDATTRPPLPPQLATSPTRPFAPARTATPVTLRAASPPETSAAGL